MIIINSTPKSNGAYANQYSAVSFIPPDGWLVVPEHLETAAKQFLPFALLTIEGETIINIEDNPNKSPPEPELAPPPSFEEMNQKISELEDAFDTLTDGLVQT